LARVPFVLFGTKKRTKAELGTKNYGTDYDRFDAGLLEGVEDQVTGDGRDQDPAVRVIGRSAKNEIAGAPTWLRT